MEFNYVHIYGLIALVILALIFFATEWVSPDVVAIGLALTLALTGLVKPAQAFAGFGSDTVILIVGLLILTAALMRTGVVDLVGRKILRITGTNETRLLVVVMLASAFLGAFMSNTASTAFFLPVVFGLARKAEISPSCVLLPLAFSSILTSSVSLISTSTNVVVSGIMTQKGLAPMGMFELAPVGIPIAITGILYMLTIGRKLTPRRSNPDDLEAEFGLREYLTEVLVLPGSKFVGKSLKETGLGEMDLQVVRVVRAKTEYVDAYPGMTIHANDVLLVRGARDDILKIKDASGIEIKSDVKLSDKSTEAEDVALIEVIVQPRSNLIGKSLKSYGFRERHHVHVVGLNRHGAPVTRKMSRVPLRMGDVLLVQGHKKDLSALEQSDDVRVLGEVEPARPNVSKAPIAIAIFVATLLIATFKVFGLNLATSVMLGAFLVFVTRCISPSEAYASIEWKAVFLIACMLSLGIAMDQTGTSRYLSEKIISATSGLGTLGLLGGFFLLTVLLTQPMSNQAAAIVVLPIAIETANQSGLNPRTFAMMVAVAASCSYLTPLEPACLMVYGPGRYQFRDFLKVGGLLTLIVFGLALWLVPRIWPLTMP
jgi:di/tricarboxylate transporter